MLGWPFKSDPIFYGGLGYLGVSLNAEWTDSQREGVPQVVLPVSTAPDQSGWTLGVKKPHGIHG